jgi:hypothetical protein
MIVLVKNSIQLAAYYLYLATYAINQFREIYFFFCRLMNNQAQVCLVANADGCLVQPSLDSYILRMGLKTGGRR